MCLRNEEIYLETCQVFCQFPLVTTRIYKAGSLSKATETGIDAEYEVVLMNYTVCCGLSRRHAEVIRSIPIILLMVGGWDSSLRSE